MGLTIEFMKKSPEKAQKASTNRATAACTLLSRLKARGGYHNIIVAVYNLHFELVFIGKAARKLNCVFLESRF